MDEDKMKRKLQRIHIMERGLREMEADCNDPRHGTRTGYVYGCRCERCSYAESEYQAEYRRAMKERRNRSEEAVDNPKR